MGDKKELFNMPLIADSTKKEKKEKCLRCGWTHEDHRFGIYCYHYSDEDSDYFYDGSPVRLVFVPQRTKIIGENMYGKIYESDKI